jgi:hypothetical protein
VSTVVVLPVGQRPKTVASVVTASIGRPTVVDGVDAWFRVASRLAHVRPRATPSIASPPVTRVLRPTRGQTLKGGVYLAAQASAAFGLARVTFEYVGDGQPPTVIGRAQRFPYGWLGGWNTANVPNGTYTVYSVATDDLGDQTRSAGVQVHVGN